MKHRRIHGIHAPPPRPTTWAAALLATALSLLFLGVLGALRLMG